MELVLSHGSLFSWCYAMCAMCLRPLNVDLPCEGHENFFGQYGLLLPLRFRHCHADAVVQKRHAILTAIQIQTIQCRTQKQLHLLRCLNIKHRLRRVLLSRNVVERRAILNILCAQLTVRAQFNLTSLPEWSLQ